MGRKTPANFQHLKMLRCPPYDQVLFIHTIHTKKREIMFPSVAGVENVCVVGLAEAGMNTGKTASLAPSEI
jgi:hypothetical protein